MASSLLDRLKEQVSCAICKGHYKDPRLLPCLHTYCKQCLDNLVRTASQRQLIVCPVCRETVEIKPDGVSKLKVNFLINNLLSLVAIHSTEKKDGQTNLTCGNCDSTEAAKGRCVDCCIFLCSFCFSVHPRFLNSKNHKLLTLDQIKKAGNPPLGKQLFCEKHRGEVRKLFCESCKEMICRDCTIVDHRDHKFQFNDDVAEKHKDEIKQKINKASSMRKEVVGVLNSVREMKVSVEKTSMTVQKEIDSIVSQQIKAIQKKQVLLKNESKQIAATKMKQLEEQEDGLKMHLTGLHSAIEFTEKVLENGSNSDVLSISSQVGFRLQALSQKSFSRQPCQEDSIKLITDTEIFVKCVNDSLKVVDYDTYPYKSHRHMVGRGHIAVKQCGSWNPYQ